MKQARGGHWNMGFLRGDFLKGLIRLLDSVRGSFKVFLGLWGYQGLNLVRKALFSSESSDA